MIVCCVAVPAQPEHRGRRLEIRRASRAGPSGPLGPEARHLPHSPGFWTGPRQASLRFRVSRLSRPARSRPYYRRSAARILVKFKLSQWHLRVRPGHVPPRSLSIQPLLDPATSVGQRLQHWPPGTDAAPGPIPLSRLQRDNPTNTEAGPRPSAERRNSPKILLHPSKKGLKIAKR